MDIFKLAKEFKIPATKLKQMQRRGFLSPEISTSHDIVEQAKTYLRNNRKLSVAMYLEFLRNDDLRDEFTGLNARKLSDALAEVGDPKNGCYHGPSTDIFGASVSEPEALKNVTNWLLRTIPANGCGYHYIAVRLIWTTPEAKFSQTYSRLARAIINARAMPQMRGLSETVNGTTRFFPPENSFFDL